MRLPKRCAVLYALHLFCGYGIIKSDNIPEGRDRVADSRVGGKLSGDDIDTANRLGMVRSIDIATELGFSKPSVSVFMKNLRENGYILVDKDGYITLTDTGRAIADKIYERHQMIAEILMALGVDEETAYRDSCQNRA